MTKDMVRYNLLIALMLAAGIEVSAQTTNHQWSLKECINYALDHNISVKQQENNRRQKEIELSTSRNSRLPNLSVSGSQNFSFGRGLTSQNTYENKNTSSTSLSLGTTVPLFTGYQIPNTIKLNQLNLEAATADLEKAKNDIRTQVAQAYVQILYDIEISEVAKRQIAIDSMQVVRLKTMVENGMASEAQLSQQRATEAQSRLTATQADNNYRIALLSLSQLLELSSPEGFTVVVPTVNELSIVNSQFPTPNEVFESALGFRPEIRAEQSRLNGTESSIKIAKSALYPQLSFNAGLGSNYYKTSGYDADAFMTQVKNNFSQYIGLNLSVPIFNRFSTRNSIRSAEINRETQQLQLENTKKTLYKEIQQVYYNAIAAKSKYESSMSARQSNEDAFKLMQAKYENGKANITEFNESKNNLLKSESDLLQARYEYLYQTKLLDFYKGKELNF
jgi:outer membrane protein